MRGVLGVLRASLRTASAAVDVGGPLAVSALMLTARFEDSHLIALPPLPLLVPVPFSGPPWLFRRASPGPVLVLTPFVDGGGS